MVYRIAADHYKNETWAAIAEAQTDDRPFVWWVAGMGRTPGIPMSDLLTLTYPAYKPTKSDDEPTQPSPTPATPARWRNSTEGVHAWLPFDDVTNHTISKFGEHIDFVWGAAETRIPEWRAANADIVLAKCKCSSSPLCLPLRLLPKSQRSCSVRYPIYTRPGPRATH